MAGTHQTVTGTEAGGYQVPAVSTATKTLTPLRGVPQSITVVTQDLMADQMMMSIGDGALGNGTTAGDLMLAQSERVEPRNFFQLAHGLCSREHNAEHF